MAISVTELQRFRPPTLKLIKIERVNVTVIDRERDMRVAGKRNSNSNNGEKTAVTVGQTGELQYFYGNIFVDVGYMDTRLKPGTLLGFTVLRIRTRRDPFTGAKRLPPVALGHR